MNDETCDVLVVGSGAAGLTTAVTAQHYGCDVIIAEKSNRFGGSSALSGGWLWIPLNPAAVRDGMKDSADEAVRYVKAETREHFHEELVRSYLAAGPRMIAFLEQNTIVRFQSDYTFADYHPDLPGGMSGGRSIVAEPFDGRELGENFSNLRSPLVQLTFMGLTIGSGVRMKHFLNVTKSIKSAAFVAKLIAQYAIHLVRYGRGVQLYNGNALIARLAKSAFEKGVRVWLSSPATELLVENGRVCGAVVLREGRSTVVRAKRAVVLATGGFPHDIERRNQLFPAGQMVSIAPREITGDGARMAERVGGRVRGGSIATAYSCVFSTLRGPGGEPVLIPHFVDRAKPGIILVNSEGRRFCNESNSYHDVAQAMLRDGIDGRVRKAFLVADHRAIRRYGLGAVRPAPIPLTRHLKNGYLVQSPTIAELAERIGIDPAALNRTMAEFNIGAKDGVDPAFGRGKTAYNAFQGDYGHKPNPCLAPLAISPYYAVEVVAGDLGTFAGIKVSARAEVLDAQDQPVPGLYSVGNDSAHPFEGACLGGGVTVGPAMVFGFIAANTIVAAGG